MNTWWWWPRCCWALILVTLVYGYIMTMGVRLDLEHHAEVGLHSDNESYQEMCQTNAQCPGKFMHCQETLCICDHGYSFSHPLASCETSNKIFREFTIEGPSQIWLPRSEPVVFRANIEGGHEGRGGKWNYRWAIHDGINKANFTGTNESALTLTELKAGFVLFGLSIFNDEEMGYLPCNLTIIGGRRTGLPNSTYLKDIDGPKIIAKIVECGKEAGQGSGEIRIWPSQKYLKLCGNYSYSLDPVLFYKWARIDHSLNPIDISGSSSPMLELSNFQITDNSQPYEFLLTVIDDKKRSSNASVKVFVGQLPKRPAIRVQNATIQLPTNSATIWAQNVDGGQIDTVTWQQTGGPMQLKLRDPNSLNLSVDGLKKAGVYTFRVSIKSSDGHKSDAFGHVKVEESAGDLPVLHANKVVITLPSKPIFLEPSYVQNVDRFEWEPYDDVPAAMLVNSDLSSPRLLLGPFVGPGLFRFKLTGFGDFDVTSIVMELEVKTGPEAGEGGLELVARREAGHPFQFGEQKALLLVVRSILKNKFEGHHFAPNITSIAYDDNTRILGLKMHFGHPKSPSTTADLALALRNNGTLFEKFGIFSVKPMYCTSSSSSCACGTFWTQNPFRMLFADNEPSDCSFPDFYLWLPILLAMFVLTTVFHSLWQSQESEHKAFEKLRTALANKIGQNEPSVNPGRLSPVGTMQKRKKGSRKGSVNKTLDFVETNYGPLPDETSDYDYDEDDGF